MQYENKMIMALCEFISPDKEKIERLMENNLDYPYILGQLLYNRMGGAAYHTLQKCALLGTLNREFRNTLKTIYDSNCIKTKSFNSALCRLAAQLKKANFRYAVLKGGYLCGLYPRGLRTSNDIDILINGEDITKLSLILKSSGFEQGNVRGGRFIPATRAEILSSRLNRGETVPFIKRVDLPQMEFCEIDINFSLDYKARQKTDTVSKLLRMAQANILTPKGNLYTLCHEDFLIHLCAHLYKEAAVFDWVNMGRDLSIYKFADIYLFISLFADEMFCRKLSARISECGMNRECYFTLLRTKELYKLQNRFLDLLLAEIEPPDIGYLNEIVHPSNGKVYRYDFKFVDWLFCSKRKERLYEA